jgi:hypothetical protein
MARRRGQRYHAVRVCIGKGVIGMSDSYMREQCEALAQHLKLTDGKSGYVEVIADGFRVHVRKKWPGKQLATWDGLPVEWNENVGSNKAANR